jgi:hypothetical protein
MDTLRAPTATVEMPPTLPPPALLEGEAWRATLPAPPPPFLGGRAAAGTDLSTLVLVATLDRAGIQGLARRLLGRAAVRGVQSEFELMYAVTSHCGSRPVVVVDCCVPSVELEALAAMVGALPKLPLVVLWGATAPMHEAVRGFSPAARSWVRLGPSATDADVAELVEALL